MAARRPDPNEFVIGLTMAGSVSAGAYVAGALDFLFRALEDHARRDPGWRVTLKVMSGTSGGGTSAALSVAGLVAGLRPTATNIARTVPTDQRATTTRRCPNCTTSGCAS